MLRSERRVLELRVAVVVPLHVLQVVERHCVVESQHAHEIAHAVRKLASLRLELARAAVLAAETARHAVAAVLVAVRNVRSLPMLQPLRVVAQHKEQTVAAEAEGAVAAEAEGAAACG